MDVNGSLPRKRAGGLWSRGADTRLDRPQPPLSMSIAGALVGKSLTCCDIVLGSAGLHGRMRLLAHMARMLLQCLGESIFGKFCCARATPIRYAVAFSWHGTYHSCGKG